MPVNNVIRDYWVRNHATPSRCDPTPTSLAGGVLLAAGAFNLSRSFMPIWCRMRCVVERGVGISCATVTPQLRGTLRGVSAEFRYSWFSNFIVGIAGGGDNFNVADFVFLVPPLTGDVGPVQSYTIECRAQRPHPRRKRENRIE